MASAGFPADARQLVNRASQECAQYKTQYGMDIPGHVLNERMAAFMHLYTGNETEIGYEVQLAVNMVVRVSCDWVYRGSKLD